MHKKSRFVFILLVFILLGSGLWGQGVDWVIHWGPSTNVGSSTKYCEVLDMAVDQAGNSYSTGYLVGINDLDPGPGVVNLGGPGTKNVFVSKLDSNGAYVWAVWFGGMNIEEGRAITTDAAGNVYLTGHFLDTVDFDPGVGVFNLGSWNGYSAFVMKLDANGSFVWAHVIGDSAAAYGEDLVIDHAGNLVIVGEFRGNCDFDPGSGSYYLNAGNLSHVFVTKWDAAGNFIWAKDLQAQTSNFQAAVVVDGADNVITTGSFDLGCDFDPGAGSFVLYPQGSQDVFVSKLDSAGNFVWAKQLISTSAAESRGVFVDGQDQVYLAGTFFGAVDFDPDPSQFFLTSAGNYDIFICKLTDEGKLTWAKSMGSTGYDLAHDLCVRPSDGHVFSLGQFSQMVDFDPNGGQYFVDAGLNGDGFVSELDGSGNFVSAGLLGGVAGSYSSTIPQAMANGPFGTVYCAGSFRGTVDMDPGVDSLMVSAYSALDEGFVLRLDGQVMQGVFDGLGNGLEVFPNPFVDRLCIGYSGVALRDVVLLDLGGRVVAEKGRGPSAAVGMGLGEVELFCLGGAPAGIYLLRVVDAVGSVHCRKLVKVAD